MGGNCCSAEETKEIFQQYNTKKRREIVGNMKKAREGEFQEHLPGNGIASECRIMNPLLPLVEKVYTETIDIMKLDKDLLART
jgi:hypothetical protein